LTIVIAPPSPLVVISDASPPVQHKVAGAVHAPLGRDDGGVLLSQVTAPVFCAWQL
jgi:hypothetical protein